jgi:hypothetical protein
LAQENLSASKGNHLDISILTIDNIASKQYDTNMAWSLLYLDEFTTWLEEQVEDLQDEAVAHLELLRDRGPLLGRPYADSLYDSKLSNLKELRFSFEGAPIRILFVFDPKQQGVIILGGNKAGDKRWYKTNIPIAEKLYAQHLERQKKADEEALKARKRTDKDL